MTEPQTTTQSLGLFPLHAVLYPGNRIPLRIFEPRYVSLIGQCMRENAGFGVVPIKQGQEAGAIPEIFETGTIASIIDFDQGEDGLLNIVIAGGLRFDVLSTTVGDANLLLGEVRTRDPIAPSPVPVEFEYLNQIKDDIYRQLGIDDASGAAPDCAKLAYQILQFLPLEQSVKVAALSSDSATELLDLLDRELEKLR